MEIAETSPDSGNEDTFGKFPITQHYIMVGNGTSDLDNTVNKTEVKWNLH